jgi:hypothetical protein
MQEKREAADKARPPAGTVQSMKLPEAADGSTHALAAPHRLQSDPTSGTVDATVEGAEAGTYRTSSEALVGTFPVQSPEPDAGEGGRLKLHAKDLIEELGAINAQIQRIMFQVEKAVAHLATSG